MLKINGVHQGLEPSLSRLLSCWGSNSEREVATIAERGRFPLDLKLYACRNYAEEEGLLALELPDHRQYVLRMLIKTPFDDYVVPDKYSWVLPMVELAYQAQMDKRIKQPFTYLTIRHGLVDSVTDDNWHVDGFSMQITHLPEQNYIWTSNDATECTTLPIDFPEDFDPLKYNIHYYLQDQIKERKPQILQVKSKYVYCLDPYIIHRRPRITSGKQRTFIRVSFTPIEIMDKNNTENPLLDWRTYSKDRVVSFRDQLERYPNHF